jgi:hypothetical protein
MRPDQQPVEFQVKGLPRRSLPWTTVWLRLGPGIAAWAESAPGPGRHVLPESSEVRPRPEQRVRFRRSR